jgi:integrase
VDRLGLGMRINDAAALGRVSFHFLAEHYLKADFGADAVRPKSVNTISHVETVVRAYLTPRFGNEIAEDIKPLDIQRWLKSLHDDTGLAWTTISKMRGVMRRIYKIGILHEHVSKNPVLHVETRSKTDYKPITITPAQTLAILKALPSPLHFGLVLTCAATALRASEMLSLRWSDVRWDEGRIRISTRWAKGKDGAWVDLNHRPRPYQGWGDRGLRNDSRIRSKNGEQNRRVLCTIVTRSARLAPNLKHQT